MTRALSGEAPTVRRSSAVTFAVAAVLQAEPAKGNRPLLTRTLKALFAAADDSCSGSGKSWRCRVHALNCLRLLFNSSTLGAQMLQWVEQGLLCAFSGFRCTNTTASCNNSCQRPDMMSGAGLPRGLCATVPLFFFLASCHERSAEAPIATPCHWQIFALNFRVSRSLWRMCSRLP